MYILANMWFTKLIKQFFFWIDKIVYNFISSIYDLLLTIARTSVLTQADIADMADRIYKLLAIFMIFKVTLSLITYVVNPDDFSDKSKGVSKLGTNIVISLAMLVLTPYIFNYAYQFQTIILEDNSLATLIFGGSTEEEQSFFNTAGDDMAYITMSAFINPNLAWGELHECSTLIDSDTGKFNKTCKNALTKETKDNDEFKEETLTNYVAAVENNNLGLLLRQDLILATSENSKGDIDFIIDYKFIFSTVVGVVIILLLITFCMDVAVRSLKLAFLQLIAPIPIVSYVDPKSGKDGLFKKWYEMCFKTYLSLFIRLIALYFAVYIISKVADMKMVDIVNGSYQTSKLLAIFIIIGALMFAKQLPEILKGLGIKLDGDGKFTLNPLRKMEKEALGGGILKKPNDMLAKAGKAALLSPFTGASLVGRKVMAGIDSKAHGKGFWNGTKNVKSKMAQSKDKFMEKNLPHTAKSIKDKKEGREEVAKMHNKWLTGENVRNTLGGNFDALDGTNDKAYKEAGFRDEFLASKRNLDHASERQKILQRIYNARQMGQTADDILKEEGATLEKYDIDKSVVKSETKLSKTLDATNKEVSGLEKVHESWRKTYSDQADLEDAIKFNKYNPIDPTNPVRPTSSSDSTDSSTTPSAGGGSSTPSPVGSSSSSSSDSESSSSSSGSGSTSSSSGSGSTSSSNAGGGTSTTSSSEDSTPIPEGPSEAAKRAQEEENEREKEQIRERIRALKANLEEQEKKMKNIIEENEEKITKIEKQIDDTSDSATKEKLQKEKEELEEKIDNLKKQIDDYKTLINKEISHLENRLS